MAVVKELKMCDLFYLLCDPIWYRKWQRSVEEWRELMKNSEFNEMDRLLFENEVNEKLKTDIVEEWKNSADYEKFSIISMIIGMVLVLMFVVNIFGGI